jgi:hypothetical protein
MLIVKGIISYFISQISNWHVNNWIPAFAGMTNRRRFLRENPSCQSSLYGQRISQKKVKGKEKSPQHRTGGYIKRKPTTVPWANKMYSVPSRE